MSISRTAILNRIYTDLRYGFYYVAHTSNFSTSLMKAESLIELLELEDFGSVGSASRKSTAQRVTGHSLYDRFLSVLRHDPEHSMDLMYEEELSQLTERYKKLAEL